MKKFTKDNLKTIINKQFEIAWINKTFEDIKDSDTWFTDNTMTREQELEFRDYLRVYLKPFVFKFRLEKEVGHIMLSYSLKIK